VPPPCVCSRARAAARAAVRLQPRAYRRPRGRAPPEARWRPRAPLKGPGRAENASQGRRERTHEQKEKACKKGSARTPQARSHVPCPQGAPQSKRPTHHGPPNPTAYPPAAVAFAVFPPAAGPPVAQSQAPKSRRSERDQNVPQKPPKRPPPKRPPTPKPAAAHVLVLCPFLRLAAVKKRPPKSLKGPNSFSHGAHRCPCTRSRPLSAPCR
jgi:hypothetical protein